MTRWKFGFGFANRSVMWLAFALIGFGGETAYGASQFDDIPIIFKKLNDVLENNRSGVNGHWYNPKTGHSGTIKPVRTIVAPGRPPCRDYERVFRLRDGKRVLRGTACRTDRGVWKVRGKEREITVATKPRPWVSPDRKAVEISDTQRLMSRAGFYKGPVNGQMDGALRTAILDYQAHANSEFDGRSLERQLDGGRDPSRIRRN